MKDQRTAIENALTVKINEKTTIEGIKNIYDPLIKVINLKLGPKETIDSLNNLSLIVDNNMALKIKNFFPAEKQSSIVKRIYRGSRDGWELSVF